MIPLVCPVRGCRVPLVRVGRALACGKGHSFDLAASGYCNLLQPQDSRARAPGDTEATVLARRRWLTRGFADALVSAIGEEVEGLGLAPGSALLDVGCGDGFFGIRLARRHGFELCGIDLSRDAARLAARTAPEATWLVANADRDLPVADGAARLVLSLFGRRHADELRRVLDPAGRLLVAVPGPRDLAELRYALHGRVTQRDRQDGVIAELAGSFTLERRRRIGQRARLDASAIADALAATYRGARRAERARLPNLDSLDVGLETDLLVFRTLTRTSRPPR